MSGEGNRFKAAGYETPKPLLTIEGRPLIAHVLDMFPGLTDTIFICNENHLASGPMREILGTLIPDSTIIGIPSHKLGPVHALTYSFPYLNDEEDVIISYCDFTQNWDFKSFFETTKTRTSGGAVPAYTGFHPHLLKKNLYAGILTSEDGLMQSIQEKHSFTKNPEESYHSSGVYYFNSARLLKDYTAEMLKEKDTLNGEYYVSMLYPRLLRDNVKVAVPSIKHFMQWGTPEDLEEYEAWSRKIHSDLTLPKEHTDTPKDREKFVTIPYPSDTVEFKKSYQYWKDYFLCNQ